jgi:hypothetical protein
MTDELSRFSRRQVVGGLGVGLATMIETPAYSQSHSSTLQPVQQMQDPASKYPTPPFKRQSQPWPGLTAKMESRPDHGETPYKGSGRLAGRKALASSDASYTTGAIYGAAGGTGQP